MAATTKAVADLKVGIFPDKLSGSEKPQIAFVAGDGKPKKLHLSLRTLSIEEELAKVRLPRNIEKEVEGLINDRLQGLEIKYRITLRWIKLNRTGGEFWKRFKCNTLDEFMSQRLDIAVGDTLAKWQKLVETFDRETVLLAGDRALGYMVLQVVYHEKYNEKKQLEAYKTIFKNFCAKSTAFDKGSFEKEVDLYMKQHYPDSSVEPKADSYGKRRERRVRKGVVIKEDETGKEKGKVEPTVKVVVEEFTQFAKQQKILNMAIRQLLLVEDLLRQAAGPKAVPARPSELNEYITKQW